MAELKHTLLLAVIFLSISEEIFSRPAVGQRRESYRRPWICHEEIIPIDNYTQPEKSSVTSCYLQCGPQGMGQVCEGFADQPDYIVSNWLKLTLGQCLSLYGESACKQCIKTVRPLTCQWRPGALRVEMACDYADREVSEQGATRSRVPKLRTQACVYKQKIDFIDSLEFVFNHGELVDFVHAWDLSTNGRIYQALCLGGKFRRANQRRTSQLLKDCKWMVKDLRRRLVPSKKPIRVRRQYCTSGTEI